MTPKLAVLPSTVPKCAGFVDSARDTSTPLLLTLYEFEARARLGDPRLEEVLEHALSLPATEPKAFHTLAGSTLAKMQFSSLFPSKIKLC